MGIVLFLRSTDIVSGFKKKRWAPVPSSGRALLLYQKKDVDMQHREAACTWNWPLPL